MSHPFTAVSGVGLDLDSIRGVCLAYEPLLRPGEAFSHATAARLHGLPLPPDLPLRPLHLLAPPDMARARTAGVVGHESATPFVSWLESGLPVASPVLAWCQLAASLEVADLVAVGDALVTGRRNGRHRVQALATIDELRAAVRAWGRRRGARRLAEALPQVRVGPESRPETLLRLVLVRSGLPEPEIALPVVVGEAHEVLHPDLAYPDWRVAIEYEGEHHRDRARWKRDITRRERFEASGWRVIRVTSDDLFGDPDAMVERVRRVVALQTAGVGIAGVGIAGVEGATPADQAKRPA
ncbi:hypothetical protein GCM10009761_01220 [Agromyces terreus]